MSALARDEADCPIATRVGHLQRAVASAERAAASAAARGGEEVQAASELLLDLKDTLEIAGAVQCMWFPMVFWLSFSEPSLPLYTRVPTGDVAAACRPAPGLRECQRCRPRQVQRGTASLPGPVGARGEHGPEQACAYIGTVPRAVHALQAVGPQSVDPAHIQARRCRADRPPLALLHLQVDFGLWKCT